MQVRVVWSDHGLAVGEVGSMCIAVWRGGVTRARFQRQRAGLAEVAAAHPEGVAFLCVIEPTANPPDEEHRRASVQMLGAFGTTLRCVALVIEAGGFRGAMIHTVTHAMNALRTSREPPAAVFVGVPTALRWVGEHLRIGPVDAVAAAVEQVRAVLPPLVDTF